MSLPQSHLSNELDHACGAFGESLLADAMLQWRPSSKTLQSNLIEETLSHARAMANILAGILEHRAVMVGEGGGSDIADAWDVFGLADVLGTFLEIVTIVRRRECPDTADAEPEATIEQLWLSGGNGNGAWVDAQVKDRNPAHVVISNGCLHTERDE